MWKTALLFSRLSILRNLSLIWALLSITITIQRWNNLKVSLQGRITSVKMNLLPWLKFLFFMLPLSPPPDYYKDSKSMISMIKLARLYKPIISEGLAVPNFKLYY